MMTIEDIKSNLGSGYATSTLKQKIDGETSEMVKFISMFTMLSSYDPGEVISVEDKSLIKELIREYIPSGQSGNLKVLLGDGDFISLQASDIDAGLLSVTTKTGVTEHLTTLDDSGRLSLNATALPSFDGVSVWTIDEIVESLVDTFQVKEISSRVLALVLNGEASFANVIGSLSDMKDNLMGNAGLMYNTICSQTAGSIPNIMNVVTSVLKGQFNYSSSNNDGTIDFSPTDYRIANFCWGAIASSVSSAVGLIGMILTPFSRILGIAITGIGALAGYFSNRIKEEITDLTYFHIDETSTSDHFAIPILQKKYPLSLVETYLKPQSFYDRLVSNKVVKVVAPGAVYYYWIQTNENTSIDELFIEGFLRLDTPYITETESDKSFGSLTTASIAGEPVVILSCNNVGNYNAHHSLPDESRLTDLDYYTNRIKGGLITFFSNLLRSNKVFNPDRTGNGPMPCYFVEDMGEEVLHSIWTDTSNHYYYWLKLVKNNINSGADLDLLINTYIPKIRELASKDIFPEAGASSEANIIQLRQYLAPLTFSAFNIETVYYVTSQDKPRFYPPRYSKGALLRTVLLTAGVVAVITAGAFVAKSYYKRMLIAKSFQKRKAIEEAGAALAANPTLANAKAYNKAIKKYNKFGRLSGTGVYNGFSQFVESESSSTGVVTQLYDGISSMSDIKKLITG
jgi:hypothetical protein